ncbi:MAG: DNA-3-methyladenine glycosylase 2 family protein [Dehalococcoidia bacterium]
MPAPIESGARAILPLTEASLADAVEAVAAQDRDLARVLAVYGCPPLWGRPSGFDTLVSIILEQQVSLASARAAFGRLCEAGPVTPESFLRFSDGELLRIGFSRQKAGYCRGLARAVVSGDVDITALDRLDDDEVYPALMRLKGIGRWTASIYLLMALGRPDVWPTGDIALLQALQEVKGLPNRPTDEEAMRSAEAWRPWRAAAARLLWHWYLSSPRPRRKKQPTDRINVTGAILSSPRLT